MLAIGESKHSLGFHNRTRIQAWIFLLFWPLLNVTIITSAMLLLDTFSWRLFLFSSVKMWLVFGISYLLFNWLEALLKKPLTRILGSYIWLFRPLLIVFFFLSTAPIIDMPGEPRVPAIKIMPTIVILLEVAIYCAVMCIMQQQEFYYHAQMQAQKAELQVLKMQSNPHFLFNTLNLIANEVTKQPERAKELIYNLSDMLRDTVKLANEQWVTIEEELRLVEPYLLLQQKRFEDRLTFDIDCPSDLDSQLMPSLLLLPAVENAIKHGVSPYAKAAHIGIYVNVEKGGIIIEVQDTGEPFDDKNVIQGDGLRILHETLRLHFGSDYAIALTSSEEGASLILSFPENK